MIYEALLVPHEDVPSLREVKRALPTYDKVILVDPNDRDLFPANAFLAAIGVPFIGTYQGAIRPMGKSEGCDERFGLLVESCKTAISQGLLEIQPTYALEVTRMSTVGHIPLGGYPLAPHIVFQLYRRLAEDPDFLISAIDRTKKSLLELLRSSPQLATHGTADLQINDGPVLPQLSEQAHPGGQSMALTQIARGRIGALVKYAGYCDVKGLIPLFKSQVYSDLVVRLLNNARAVLGDVEEEDSLWHNRNRILELCHEEFLDGGAIDKLSLAEVIRLRSKAWGKQAAARESLFESVREIADNSKSTDNFEERTRALIIKYRESSESLIKERANLRLRIKCDLASAVLVGGVAAPPIIAGLSSQIAAPLNVFATFVAGGLLYYLKKSQEYGPALREMQSKERALKRGPGFGLHDFYSRL